MWHTRLCYRLNWDCNCKVGERRKGGRKDGSFEDYAPGPSNVAHLDKLPQLHFGHGRRKQEHIFTPLNTS